MRSEAVLSWLFSSAGYTCKLETTRPDAWLTSAPAIARHLVVLEEAEEHAAAARAALGRVELLDGLEADEVLAVRRPQLRVVRHLVDPAARDPVVAHAACSAELSRRRNSDASASSSPPPPPPRPRPLLPSSPPSPPPMPPPRRRSAE